MLRKTDGLVKPVCAARLYQGELSPLGKRDYWSKFSYNFIFYVDEMHLKGRGSGWRRGRALSQASFPPHTDARCDSEAEA